MNFENRLTGGHPNSLGNTIEIVEEVLADSSKFDELFNCYFSEDEVVRLRVSNAMKRVCKEQPELLTPYLDRFINEISQIEQASTQWTLAQLFLLLEDDLSDSQKEKAVELVKNNLANHNDWIVLNASMETLFQWSKEDEDLRKWLLPHLERLSKDERKSVSKRASKFLSLSDKK